MLFKTVHMTIANEKLIRTARKNFTLKKSLKAMSHPNVGTIT